MSCNAPRPCSTVGAAPPMSTTGDCASCAFLTAVMVFVSPGPAVTAATPGRPVSRATASAANTAVASCLVSTTLIPRALAPMSTGEMWPPHSVNRNSTPCARSTSPTRSPPCTSGHPLLVLRGHVFHSLILLRIIQLDRFQPTPSCRARRATFPMGVIGNCDRNTTSDGTLYGTRCSMAYATSSSAVTVAPGRRTTYALIRSPL